MPQGRLSLDLAENTRHYLLYHEDAKGNPSDVEFVTQEELQGKILEILGRTKPFPPDTGVPGPGSIARVMPWADPVFPALFAEDVSASVIDGEGLEAAANADPDFAVTPVQGHANYLGYDLAVRFTQRPFAVFPNERLNRESVDFYDQNNQRWRLYHYREWLRYTRVQTKPLDVRVSAQQGSAMQFRAPGIIDVPSGLAIDGTPFSGIVDMPVNDAHVIIQWFGVPARYVDSTGSYLRSLRGRINQADWFQWTAGSLLYLNAEVARRYVQLTFTPSPESDVSSPELVGTFVGETMVDLELHFTHTSRTPGVTYTGAMIAAIRSNNNHVVAGHNLLGHLPTRKFWYATCAPFGGADVAKWVPSYYSDAFEKLFADPDAAGNLIML